MLPEARAMHVCRELLLPPFCLCGVGGGELGGGTGELYTAVPTGKGKSNLPKRETASHLHTA